jgi:hypothetical protein
VSQQNSKLQHQEEEKHQRIFTWMGQNHGAKQQAKSPYYSTHIMN